MVAEAVRRKRPKGTPHIRKKYQIHVLSMSREYSLASAQFTVNNFLFLDGAEKRPFTTEFRQLSSIPIVEHRTSS